MPKHLFVFGFKSVAPPFMRNCISNLGRKNPKIDFSCWRWRQTKNIGRLHQQKANKSGVEKRFCFFVTLSPIISQVSTFFSFLFLVLLLLLFLLWVIMTRYNMCLLLFKGNMRRRKHRGKNKKDAQTNKLIVRRETEKLLRGRK